MASGVVLVTGAAGFVGQALCLRLLAEGYAVRAGIRHAALPADLLARPGLTPVPCDLARPEQLGPAIQGATAIVHAAYGETTSMEAELGRLLDTATEAGVAKIVYLSSIAVYGERTGIAREDDPPLGALPPYAAAKIACEKRIAAWAAKGGHAVILRPGIIYGTGSVFWTMKLAERIRAGAWGTFGTNGEGRAALVHVDDVATAAAAALAAAPAGKALALNVTGPDSPSWNEYFTAVAGRLGVPLHEIGPLERRIRTAAAILAKIGQRAGLPGLERLALGPMPGEMRLFARKTDYPSDRALATIGRRATIGLEDGLERTRWDR
jgi:nucleoside-diphosphate-sugar epimerase